MFFELISMLFAIVPDYGNDYMTKENKNWTSFKNFALKLNLNHNIYKTPCSKLDSKPENLSLNKLQDIDTRKLIMYIHFSVPL